MRIDIEVHEEEKKLNYKKVILVFAVFLAIVSCIYIGIILPQITKYKDEQQKAIGSTEQTGKNGNRENIDISEQYIKSEQISQISREEQEKAAFELFNEKIKNIYKSDEYRVFLTFDDGPSKTVTPQILSILKQYNIKATFFVLGSRVELYPELVRQAYEEGHFIANHGYSHNYGYIYESVDNVINEYKETENVIRNAIGKEEYKSKVFRFPGGSKGGSYESIKLEAIQKLQENNIAYLDWNCLTEDAMGDFSVAELIDNLIHTSFGKKSLVVLMHDSGNEQKTYEALPGIIECFSNKGYGFESLYDI